jgi:FAD/FMN-containing dehydrogenase
MLRPLIAAAAPASTRILERSFASTLPGARSTANPVRFKGKSDILTAPLAPAAIEAVVDALGRIETGGVAMILQAYGGAVGRIGSDATAFAHRDALACVQWWTMWANAGQTAARLAMMRSLYARVHPLFSGGAYVNYCDSDLTDGPRAYFAAHLDRLQQLKRGVDPANRFRSNLLGV